MAIFASLFLKKPMAYWLEAGEGRRAVRADQRFRPSLCRSAARARHGDQGRAPVRAALSLIRNPITFSETPVKDYRAPPLLGQNTREILASRLGYDDAKLDALKKREII